MFQQFCLIGSVCVFFLGILTVIYIGWRYKGKPDTLMGYLFAVVALSLFLLYINGNVSAPGGILDILFSSILGVIRAMTGENAVADTRDMLGVLPPTWEGAYAIYTAIVHLTSVVLLLGFLLSLVQNLLPKLRYRLSPQGEVYVFSAVNLRSVLLAEDIHRHCKTTKTPCILVFLSQEPTADTYGDRIRDLDGFLFQTTVCELSLHNRQRQRPVHFFLLQADQSANLADALALTAQYHNQTQKTEFYIHIHSEKVNAVSVVDSIDCSTNLRLRLIHENQSKLYQLFDTCPLFLGKRYEQLTILVVGAGGNGLEAVRIASWCGQTGQLRPHIVVLDNDPTVEDRFGLLCPELAPKMATTLSKAECTITFHTVDVTSVDFTALLGQYPQVGYVICAVGDDELNLRTAITVRQVYNQLHHSPPYTQQDAEPLIHVLLDDPFLNQAAQTLQFDTRVPCHLTPFGDLTQTYSYQNLLTPYTDGAGKAVNRFYERHFSAKALAEEKTTIQTVEAKADGNFENKEYNRGSSVAAGMHCKAKLYTCLEEGGLAENIPWHLPPSPQVIAQYEAALTQPTLGTQRVEALANLEHRRWNLYMRAEGWRTATPQVAEHWFATYNDHRNFAAKLHPCITAWEDLPAIDTWLNESHGKDSHQQNLDRLMVQALPTILTQAAQLAQEP